MAKTCGAYIAIATVFSFLVILSLPIIADQLEKEQNWRQQRFERVCFANRECKENYKLYLQTKNSFEKVSNF